jgi:uncharacterized repeat protein (TIGR01451 family)
VKTFFSRSAGLVWLALLPGAIPLAANTLIVDMPPGTQSLTLQDNGSGTPELVASFLGAPIAYSSLYTININCGGGADTITIEASGWADAPTGPITVNGSGSNNTLIADLTGATTPNLPVTNSSGNLSGTWTFGNRSTLTFSDIQSLNPTDVSVTNSGPAYAPLGSNISYTITVNNAGPNWAAGVTATDALPANTTFVSATPSQGSCSGTATVTCSLGLIGPGGSATIALVLTVNSGTTVSDTATVTLGTTDTNPANNSSTWVASVAGTIPTLSPWGLAVLAALLAGCGAISYRRATGC